MNPKEALERSLVPAIRVAGGLLVCLQLAGLAGCTREVAAPDVVVFDAGPSDAGPSKPTPEQEKALANRLHKSHLKAEPPLECSECHRIAGRGPTVGEKHRCLGCHHESASAIHAKAKDQRATECLGCHDFLAADVDPWRCAACHVPGAPIEHPDLAQNAPQILVHAREACGTCHRPHGDRALQPKPCKDCHERVVSKHHAKELADPEQCMECHLRHEPASDVLSRCAPCHEKKVPPTALVKGHEKCTLCHQPHNAREAQKPCESCHDKIAVVGADKAPEHKKCLSCHEQHDARVSPRLACVKCHDKVTVAHPPDDKGGKGTCVGCHPQHAVEGRLVRAASCSGAGCHDKAKSPTSFHAGDLNCAACHVPHGPSLKGSGATGCLVCHGPKAPPPAKVPPLAAASITAAQKAKSVQPVKGHDKCADCHLEGNHNPQKARPECKSCHEPVVKSLTRGHDKCLDCHSAHNGKVEKACQHCHEKQASARHAGKVKEKEGCFLCHRPHGPKGVDGPKACLDCHKDALPGVHAHPEHRKCDACHAFHDPGPNRGRQRCLEPCHQKMANHEPNAQSCMTCHPFGGK